MKTLPIIISWDQPPTFEYFSQSRTSLSNCLMGETLPYFFSPQTPNFHQTFEQKVSPPSRGVLLTPMREMEHAGHLALHHAHSTPSPPAPLPHTLMCAPRTAVPAPDDMLHISPHLGSNAIALAVYRGTELSCQRPHHPSEWEELGPTTIDDAHSGLTGVWEGENETVACLCHMYALFTL